MRRVFLAALLAACGDDGGTMTTVDAPVQQTDAPATDCLIPASYGDLGSKTGTQGANGNGDVTATFEVDAGPPRDTFFIKLVDGNGVFASGVTPGTYTIAGDDADFNNCGLCVHIIADIVAGQGPTKFYFAHSGTVTLTGTSNPVSGSAQNLMFREVALATGQPLPGGCTSSLQAIAFTTN